jgi:hypothetical protein
MLFDRRKTLALLGTVTSSLPFVGLARAESPPDRTTIEEAYVYLLGRVLVIRQEHTDLTGTGITYNEIKYNPPGSADFVNPNFDVAYLEAWFAVDERTPVILGVPEVKDRYYTAELLDEWGEVIVNINERTMPSKPFGKFALVKPGWTGSLPPDVSPIELHSNKAKMLCRVELKGDPDGAVQLQKAFTAKPLGTPLIEPPLFVPTFTNKELIGVSIFDDIEARLSSALDVSPVAASMQQKVRAVAAYVHSSEEARVAVDKLLRDKIIPGFVEYAFTKSAPYRNHWVGGGRAGNYGSDYRLRTSVNYAGIWANNIDEVVYFIASRDADEKPLNGSDSYVIHFPTDKLPQSAVDAYWSVILVSVPDYRVVPNDLKRYNFNNHSPLKSENDGSLKIAIGPKPVRGVPESNWLPSPEGKPFSLTFRAYVPKDSVKEGQWTPPAVEKAS